MRLAATVTGRFHAWFDDEATFRYMEELDRKVMQESATMGPLTWTPCPLDGAVQAAACEAVVQRFHDQVEDDHDWLWDDEEQCAVTWEYACNVWLFTELDHHGSSSTWLLVYDDDGSPVPQPPSAQPDRWTTWMYVPCATRTPCSDTMDRA